MVIKERSYAVDGSFTWKLMVLPKRNGRSICFSSSTPPTNLKRNFISNEKKSNNRKNMMLKRILIYKSPKLSPKFRISQYNYPKFCFLNCFFNSGTMISFLTKVIGFSSIRTGIPKYSAPNLHAKFSNLCIMPSRSKVSAR